MDAVVKWPQKKTLHSGLKGSCMILKNEEECCATLSTQRGNANVPKTYVN